MSTSPMEPEDKPRVVSLRPEDIAFDGSNPRGESKQEIESDPTFTQLRDSVFQYGVLVPIVVHPQGEGAPKKFRLVDGERRLRAALANRTKWIPARISEPSRTLDDVIQAFHIHMLRKQWDQPAMTRGLKRLLKHRKWENREKFANAEIEELQSLTGCTVTQLRSLLRGARYSEEILAEVETKKLRWSHLIQIEESFVEPIEQQWPRFFEGTPKTEVRKALLAKARRRVLGSTRDLMDNVVPVITRAKIGEQADFAEKLLTNFVRTMEMPAEEVLRNFELKYPEAMRDASELMDDIASAATRLNALLGAFSPHTATMFPEKAREVRESLAALNIQLKSKLRGLDRISL